MGAADLPPFQRLKAAARPQVWAVAWNLSCRVCWCDVCYERWCACVSCVGVCERV